MYGRQVEVKKCIPYRTKFRRTGSCFHFCEIALRCALCSRIGSSSGYEFSFSGYEFVFVVFFLGGRNFLRFSENSEGATTTQRFTIASLEVIGTWFGVFEVITILSFVLDLLTIGVVVLTYMTTVKAVRRHKHSTLNTHYVEKVGKRFINLIFLSKPPNSRVPNNPKSALFLRVAWR